MWPPNMVKKRGEWKPYRGARLSSPGKSDFIVLFGVNGWGEATASIPPPTPFLGEYLAWEWCFQVLKSAGVAMGKWKPCKRFKVQVILGAECSECCGVYKAGCWADWVVLSDAEYDWEVLSMTGRCWVWLGGAECDWEMLSVTGRCWVWLGGAECDWMVLSGAECDWMVLSVTGWCWVVLSMTGWKQRSA